MIKSYPKDKDRIPVSEFRKLKVKPEKSLAALKKDLDKVFNAYIRKRDTVNGMFTCISCGEIKPIGQMNAGHFYSAGHHSSLRWVEENVNGQCVRCNNYLSGNLIRYRAGMVKKYGYKVLNDLEIQCHNKSKIMQFEVKLLIETYKAKMKKHEYI